MMPEVTRRFEVVVDDYCTPSLNSVVRGSPTPDGNSFIIRIEPRVRVHKTITIIIINAVAVVKRNNNNTKLIYSPAAVSHARCDTACSPSQHRTRAHRFPTP